MAMSERVEAQLSAGLSKEGFGGLRFFLSIKWNKRTIKKIVMSLERKNQKVSPKTVGQEMEADVTGFILTWAIEKFTSHTLFILFSIDNIQKTVKSVPNYFHKKVEVGMMWTSKRWGIGSLTA